MRTPDGAPTPGAQLMDGGPDSTNDRCAGAASSHLPDSDQHFRGLAATADSTSYDTDIDFQTTYGQTCKPYNSTSLVKPAVLRPFPLCPAFRGFSADEEGPANDLQTHATVGDLARYLCQRARLRLLRLHEAAFEPPECSTNAGTVGALRSLVTRQVHVGLETWMSCQEKEKERQANLPQSCPSRFYAPGSLLHPLCGAAMGWSTAMLLFDVVFTAFLVPVNVAFCIDKYGRLDAVCTRTDLAGGIVYLVNLLLGFQVGVTVTCGYRSRVVMTRRTAARLYVSTLSFWLDMLAVAPFVYLIVVLGMKDTVARHQTVSIISLIRLVRLFRVASIIKQLYSSSTGGDVASSWVADHFSVMPMYMALLTYMAMVLVNLYACLLLLIAHYEQQQGKISWMSSVSWQDVGATQPGLRWFNAVYFSITVMTTTGYADFVPKSAPEQVLVSVMMLNGLVIFGTVVALIGSGLKRSQETAQKAHDKRKRLTILRQWLQEGKVPERVCKDVITFFGELSARRDGGCTESDIVFELPSYLRQQIAKHVVLGLLSQCPPLARLRPEVLELIASHCVPIELPTGHDLFRLGDDMEAGGGGLWLLEEGMVAAYRNKEMVEMTDGVPCLIGEGAVLADIMPGCSSRMWTIRTERPCRLWQLREPALRASLQIYPAIADNVMAYVRDRITAWLSGEQEREEGVWCEVVQLIKRSFVMGPLRERLQDCYLALQLASLQDGTLAQLLSAWIEMSATREMKLKQDDQEASDAIIRSSLSWSMRAASANPESLVTPAATPEQQPATPEASIAGGRAGRGNATVPWLHAPANSAFQAPARALFAATVRGEAAQRVSGGGVFTLHDARSGSALIGGGGGGGGGGGVAMSSRTLPLPLSPLGSASTLAPSPPPLLPQLSLRLQSDSERSSPTLHPVVEKALMRAETIRRSRGGGGSARGDSSARGDGSARGGGSYGRGAIRSESGAAVGNGLTRTQSNPLVATFGDILAIPAVATGLAIQARPDQNSAVRPGPMAQERSSAPAGGFLSSGLVSANSASSAEPSPCPRASPFTAGVESPFSDGSSPFTAHATATAAAPAASTAVANELVQSDGSVYAPATTRQSVADRQQLSPSGTATAAAVTAGMTAAPAPTSESSSSGQNQLVSVGPCGSGNASRSVAAESFRLNVGLSPTSPHWISVPEAVHAALAGQSSRMTTSSNRWCSPPPSGSAAEAEFRRAPSAGYRRLSSFDGDDVSEGGQHLVIEPMSPPASTSPTLPTHQLWYGVAPGSAAAAAAAMAAAAAKVRHTPMSPQVPSVRNRNSVVLGAAAVATTSELPSAPPSQPPPQAQPPPPAAVALSRQASIGGTTFIHKIFLAAGVNLHPPRHSNVAVVSTAGMAAVASEPRPQGPIIVAPACTSCGCATCAYCARPIVPHGTSVAMAGQKLEQAARSLAPPQVGGSGAVGSGAPQSPLPIGLETSISAHSGGRGGLPSIHGGPSRQNNAMSAGGGGGGSRPLNGVNTVSSISSRPGSGVNQNIGGAEYTVGPSWSPAMRLASLSPALSAPRSPVSRLRSDCLPLASSSLTRGTANNQRLSPLTGLAQAPSLTKLRSVSGANGTAGMGRFGGGGASRNGAGSLRSAGGSIGGVGSGLVGTGSASTSFLGKLGSASSGGGSGGDRSFVSPGVALALASALVSERVNEEKPEEGGDRDGGERFREGLRPAESGSANALLPLSGTMQII